MELISTLRRIRACEGEAAAQLVLEAYVAERLAEAAEIARLDVQRIASLERVVREIPACPHHGELCLPSALEWVKWAKSKLFHPAQAAAAARLTTTAPPGPTPAG